MDAITHGPLAPEVLERDDVKRALAEHDFAAAFSLIKKWGGLSQNRIASACQLTPGKVSTIISGQQQVTSFDVICRIADGLRIPGRLVGLADRPWEEQPDIPDPLTPPTAQPSEGTAWCPAVAVHLAADLTRSDLVMDRRTATRALAGATLSGAPLLDTLEGWLQPAPRVDQGHRRGRIGQREVHELEATARAFRAWDHRFGGGLRRKAVVGQLNEVVGHLEDHQAPDVEQGLFQVMAYLGGTAATMAWDSGHQKQAQNYYLLALRAAHAADDTAFGANVLAGMARQMLYLDRPQDALELTHLAQKGAGRAANPRLRAMLHTREAWAYAAMGRAAAFRRATSEAEEALADAGGEEEPYWIAYFDSAELAGVTGGRLLDMARADPQKHAEAAAGNIRSALAGRGSEAGRSHALDLIGLAECHFLIGDLTGAVEHTHHAVDAAARTRSSRVRAQLGQLYPYTVGRSASRTVGEARARIRDVLSS
ncbi:XRE family transcriptional regulator [Streptomyces caelestis]|uniref:XRE family transcriptional regulator n=1 Tax=Streptomyces caelestis TaxID=36816 RepID=A0A0M8QP99_9ACTN|nr:MULTISPECIES: helix-turn-helix domain-containing protein [Streptomyces]KOT35296.1 XRE family transcriptional regulator [Streptomyces caelestis]